METNTILNTIVEQIKNISILLNPIIPISTEKVLNTINIFEKDILIENYSDRVDPNMEKQLNQILKNLESPEDILYFAAQHFISHQENSQKLLSLEGLEDQFDLIIKILDRQ